MNSQKPEEEPIYEEESVSTATESERPKEAEIEATVEEMVNTVIGIVSEGACSMTEAFVDQQRSNAADELAKSRFGISSQMEISISCKEFERLLRSISSKMAMKAPSNGKRKYPQREVKARGTDEVSSKIPKQSVKDTAGARQRKKKQKISPFGQAMAPLLLNFQDDPIFLLCSQIPGMTNAVAYRIFQINQFLCHLINFIPKIELGNVKDKNTFTNFNMASVKKALDEENGAALLEEKMMFTLATTVNYSRRFAQCQEGILYARGTFPGLDKYVARVKKY